MVIPSSVGGDEDVLAAGERAGIRKRGRGCVQACSDEPMTQLAREKSVDAPSRHNTHTAQGTQRASQLLYQPATCLTPETKPARSSVQAPESQPAGAEPGPVYSAPVVPRKEASRSFDGVQVGIL
ncbi:hypothetical protein Ddc_22755 [Ditylenchus destructor]|nr:hypothetical protein Ddc_22755 [Ditylenchus destructor]